jgi:hypothetical protein
LPERICLRASAIDPATIAAELYERTCRTDFDAPGFCLLNVGSSIGSHGFRELMVALKRNMSAIHESLTGRTLVYLSAARFDQQTSTKAHLDGGPEECFLMLGYEPSEVPSEVEIIDYAKCAMNHGVTPMEFMAKHNPMFQSGYEMLQPYACRIPCFEQHDFQILCINNSSAPYSIDRPAWQGTLHMATIPFPDEGKRRVINSTMIASVPKGTPDAITEAEQLEFIRTTAVRRSGYDKPHLQDDK